MGNLWRVDQRRLSTDLCHALCAVTSHQFKELQQIVGCTTGNFGNEGYAPNVALGMMALATACRSGDQAEHFQRHFLALGNGSLVHIGLRENGWDSEEQANSGEVWAKVFAGPVEQRRRQVESLLGLTGKRVLNWISYASALKIACYGFEGIEFGSPVEDERLAIYSEDLVERLQANISSPILTLRARVSEIG